MVAAYDQQLVRRDGKSWRRHGGVPLCEVCGAKERCDLRAGLSLLGQARGAAVLIPSCSAYQPVLGFQDRTGLSGAFNTFRRGRGWGRRVEIGTRVGLYDLAADLMLGVAVVTGVAMGPLGALLTAHAAQNHLMREAVPPAEAPERLARVLRRLYGTTYAALDQEFSVISMQIEEKEG